MKCNPETFLTPALLIGLSLLAGSAARAQESPSLQAARETAVVSLRDSRGAAVALRVPQALHRPANAFRLYGQRPLTLHDRGRRRDLYRDALLDIATRSRLAPRVTAWDSVSKQVEWLRSSGLASRTMLNGLIPGEVAGAAGSVRATLRKLEADPAFRQLGAVREALGDNPPGPPLGKGGSPGSLPVSDIAEPVAAALELRALATDAAEGRLRILGTFLRLDDPQTDPALREGYRAAAAEFEQVRQGLWPAIGASLRKHQGRLLLSAAKQIILSNLGMWAIFGYVAWQGVEGIVNTEFHGQYAVCMATTAVTLAEASGSTSEARPLAAYAEYALSYALTEALKGGALLPLQPAGGLSAGGWQIRCSERCAALRPVLAAD